MFSKIKDNLKSLCITTADYAGYFIVFFAILFFFFTTALLPSFELLPPFKTKFEKKAALRTYSDRSSSNFVFFTTKVAQQLHPNKLLTEILWPKPKTPEKLKIVPKYPKHWIDNTSNWAKIMNLVKNETSEESYERLRTIISPPQENKQQRLGCIIFLCGSSDFYRFETFHFFWSKCRIFNPQQFLIIQKKKTPSDGKFSV